MFAMDVIDTHFCRFQIETNPTNPQYATVPEMGEHSQSTAPEDSNCGRARASVARGYNLSDSFSTRSGEKATRKEYRTLTTDERNLFHRCYMSMKTSGALDEFVYTHSFDMSPEAHKSPVFFPFHRVFLTL